MRKVITVLFALTLFVGSSGTLKAQNDCCGLGYIMSSLVQSGIYGGYGLQKFNSEGLNYAISDLEGFNDFGTAYGWRIGANLLGFRHENILFNLKFYYQSVKEVQEVAGSNSSNQELDLTIAQFGVGMGFSYILGPNFDFRLLDIYLTWTGAKLTNTITADNAPPKQEFESPESSIGFTANTGIVWYPFPPYLSIELIGGYSMFSIEKVELSSGEHLPTNNMDVIDGGGLFAMAVLTVGIPFN